MSHSPEEDGKPNSCNKNLSSGVLRHSEEACQLRNSRFLRGRLIHSTSKCGTRIAVGSPGIQIHAEVVAHDLEAQAFIEAASVDTTDI